MVGLFGMGIPQTQVFQYLLDDDGIIDDGDDPHGGTAPQRFTGRFALGLDPI
jgi:hypothetical protein